MKKITDERLQWKNLQHIRIAFIVQTLGILSILGYELVISGMNQMMENPLWLVFTVTIAVMAFLHLGISVDHERVKASPKTRRNGALGVLIFFSILIAVFTSLQNGSTTISGVLLGVVIFVCGGLPLWYIYSLRKRQQED
ncbi:hypothetical protein [Marinococcus sp. PL1-022]|uniref:hypothetical protein n=1 Tax=Marinococcus sp. PL1-022 TaxID=3095363 RepID=UPI0029C54620|nr:hypothetical protein [Marinococcus sp. PL1-022]MDX6152715.1 hypothetical protein [Marinococcus sp. PL1-022]